jgi:hypothetical protein
VVEEEDVGLTVQRGELPNVEWMLHGKLMHLDLFDNVYKHADGAAVTAKALAEKRSKLASVFKGSRLDRIEASFRAVHEDATISHPSNPKLVPKRSWDVLPDNRRAGITYVQVMFDKNPDDFREPREGAKRARRDHAMLRTHRTQPASVSEGTVVVSYLLPALGEIESPDSVPSPMKLQPVREYHLVAEAAADGTGEELFLFSWDDEAGTVTYAPVKSKAKLSTLKLADDVRPAQADSSEDEEERRRADMLRDRDAGDALVFRRPLTETESEDAELIRLPLMDTSAKAVVRVREIAANRAAAKAAAQAAAASQQIDAAAAAAEASQIDSQSKSLYESRKEASNVSFEDHFDDEEAYSDN